MASVAGVDVLVVAPESTIGWEQGSRELARSLERAGASVATVWTGATPRVRTFALTDYVQARAARRAALRGIEAHDPTAIVYCSITCALLWPRPGAIYLDSIAAENRPGRHGIWQRPAERRRLAQTPLTLLWSERALQALTGPHPETVVVHVPIAAPASPGPSRDIAALTYAGDPVKRRLSLVLEAWSRARREGETLLVAGYDQPERVDGVQFTGRVSPEQFRELLARAHLFIAAPEREDYGIAALEALAAGALLVTTPSPGPYPALDLARRLDPRLVDDDLAPAIRLALDDPAPGYAQRAAELLEPFTHEAVDREVAERVLPRLVRR
jgi:glycosyltransferase involved in cell wall biosynthesis